MVKYTATKKWFMSLLKENDVNGQTALYELKVRIFRYGFVYIVSLKI